MTGFDTDRAVAIFGSLMALVIVAAAARGRGVSMRSGLVMLIVWGIVILAAAGLLAVVSR